MDSSSSYSSSNINSISLYGPRLRGGLKGIEIVLFSLGALSPFYINIIGQFYLTEILLLLLFPFLWIHSWTVLLKNRLTGRILFFGSLWFASQVFTDLIRDTPINDMLRGWASIIVFLMSFGSLYLLIGRNIRRIQLFLLGYGLGSIVGLYIQPPAYFPVEPWKFGFGYPVAILILLLLLFASSKNLNNLKKSVLPILVLGGLSVYLNARSLGAAIILTAIVIWLRNRSFGRSILTRLTPRNILAGSFILGLVIWGLVTLYSFAAQNGYLGEDARLKYAWQESGRFGLLLGGRSEILASATAIWDSPLIGHGSWARNSAYRALLYRLIDLGYDRSEAELDRYVNQSDLIPAHSHIFQAWVWAGILGAIFWGMILWMIVKTVIQSNRFPTSLYILVVFFSIGSVWDIFFSPFGSIMRLRWVFQLIVFISAYYESRQLEQRNQATFAGDTNRKG